MSAFPKISYHIFGHWRQDSSHHLTKLARTGPRLDSFSWSRLTITELSTYFKITVFSNLLLHIFVHRINYKVKSTGEPVKEQARLDRIDKVSLASSTPMKTLNFVYINLMYFNDIFMFQGEYPIERIEDCETLYVPHSQMSVSTGHQRKTPVYPWKAEYLISWT